MTEKARQYTPSTIKKLHTLSGNQCAAVGCTRSLFAKDKKTIISKICHIEAASNNGPRYNINMSDDDRRHFSNLILLCDECHSIIDNKENEDKYPVSLLKEWKRIHESKQLNRLNSNPSLLKVAINAIADADFNWDQTGNFETNYPFNIEDKIKHNAIKRNKYLIDEYKIFYYKITSLYDELEKQGSFRKEKLLRNIRNLYLKIKGGYAQDSKDIMHIIRENADSIIEDVENELLEKSLNDEEIYDEDITFGISIIMVDAFMRCKILEEPKAK